MSVARNSSETIGFLSGSEREAMGDAREDVGDARDANGSVPPTPSRLHSHWHPEGGVNDVEERCWHR